MKLELRKNMYYRTYSGFINKIISIKNFNEREYLLNGLYINKDTIKKASHNIIDLIEVGDYLNGFKVSKIERYDTNTIIKIGNSTFNVLEGEKIYTPSYDNNNGYGKIEKLKSIVTKEQMEQMAYKEGDEMINEELQEKLLSVFDKEVKLK